MQAFAQLSDGGCVKEAKLGVNMKRGLHLHYRQDSVLRRAALAPDFALETLSCIGKELMSK